MVLNQERNTIQSFFLKKYLNIYLFGCAGSQLWHTGSSLLCTGSSLQHAGSFFLKLINLFYFWLCWIFIAVHGLSLVAVSGGYSSLRCAGFSLRCLLLLQEHGLQAHGLQQLWLAGSRAQAQQLWCMGSAALQHVGSSRTRARTCVPCTGRRILNRCATREVPGSFFFFNCSMEALSCSMRAASSFLTRDRTRALCIGSIRKVPNLYLRKRSFCCHMGSRLHKGRRLEGQLGNCKCITVSVYILSLLIFMRGSAIII